MSSKDWTDRLPELLEGYTEAEPEGLWDAVLSGLTPPRRRVAAAWWYTGGALLAAAAVTAVALLWPEKSVPEVTVVPGPVIADIITPAPEASVALENLPSLADTKPSSVRTRPSSVNVLPSSVIPKPVPEPKPELEPKTEPEPDPEPRHEKEQKPEPKPGPEPEPPVPFFFPEENTRQKPSPKVQIGLSTTGCIGQVAVNTSTGIGIPGSYGLKSDDFQTKASGTKNPSAVPFTLGRNKESSTEARHLQTARLSLGVRIGISKRWGVETGIGASVLNSQFSTSAGGAKVVTTRDMYYCGVPLYLCYNLYDKGRLGLYLNGGPMYEFSFKTSAVKETYVNDVNTGREKDGGLVRDSYLSMNLNAGMQLKLGSHGAIFLQPGFSYHFLKDSGIETFYTEHPASFTFSVGYNFLF